MKGGVYVCACMHGARPKRLPRGGVCWFRSVTCVVLVIVSIDMPFSELVMLSMYSIVPTLKGISSSGSSLASLDSKPGA